MTMIRISTSGNVRASTPGNETDTYYLFRVRAGNWMVQYVSSMKMIHEKLNSIVR